MHSPSLEIDSTMTDSRWIDRVDRLSSGASSRVWPVARRWRIEGHRRRGQSCIGVGWSVVLAVLAVHASVSRAFCPGQCQCNDRLLETSCTASKLDTVPILLNPALRTLHMSHNRVSSLRQSFAFYSELRWLDLSHNSLHSLGSRHLESLRSLETLNVSANLISSLESDAFTGLVSVSVLDLSANRLTALPASLFAEMTHLQTLIISGNKIQTISEQALDSLRHLHTIHLDDNNIQHVPSASLAAAVNLRHLHLSKNLIVTLDDMAFAKLVKLRTLRLNDNALRHVEPMSFHGLTSLELLDLSFNRLDVVPFKALASPSLAHLLHLDLSGNMWRQLQSGLLHSLPRLQSLNISYMENLRRVDADALNAGYAAGNASLALRTLVMTNNALWNRFPPQLLDHLPELQRLDLSGNAFETVDKPHQLHQWNLHYLNVAYNPLECNCSLIWLWDLFRQSVEANSSLVVVNVTCSKPELLNGLQLSNVPDLESMCPPSMNASMISLLVAGWILVTGLVVGCLYYWFWRRRRLLKSTGSHHHGSDAFSGHGTSPILTKNGSPNTSHHGPHTHLQNHHYHPSHQLQQQQHQQQQQLPPQQQHHQYHQHHYQEPVQPRHQPSHYQHHHLPNLHHYYAPNVVADADEYTYHSAGTIKRIPVTVV